jgi:protein involved in polysaccharide export with SLBB domain
MNLLKSSKHLRYLLVFASLQSFAQNALDESFLEGLPQALRDQVEVENKLEKEEQLTKLFRSETSIEKNKVILNRLKAEIQALDKKLISTSVIENSGDLPRFGENFFRTIQSSFMPVNVPNLGSDYVVDVGDTFEILLTGKLESKNELMVGRDGAISIEKIGKVNIAGKTLIEAEKAIVQSIQTAAFGVDVFVSLAKIRDVQVILLGHVVSPGIFTFSGGSNILAAINIAGGIADSGSYRRIEHRRNGKLLNTIDLYDLMVFGKFDTNNVLRSGDTILVAPSQMQIALSGGVNQPAIYEALPSETIANLIEYASGFSEYYSGFSSVLVNRMSTSQSEIIEVPETDIMEFKLQPRDSIQVPSYKNEVQPVRKVTINGMVNRPGEYVIGINERLSDIIEKAGGYKENAYLYGSALFRKEALGKEKLFAQLNYSDTVNYIISNIGKTNSSVNSSVLDLLAEELRSQHYEGRIVTDFNLNNLKENLSADIKLFDQDKIVIPEVQKVVYLFGDFRKPSNYLYNPALQPQDYIKLAGGLKDSAYNEILIIDPDGKTHIHRSSFLYIGKSPDIYPGSIIYAQRDIGKISGLSYASAVSPILSSLAISLASLNSITNDK